MATRITLTSGSILNGNPITLAVTPNNIANASMHRIILEVECGMSGGNYEVIKLSSPVITEGKTQTIDISSALRTFRDSYEYTPDAVTYPLVKFNVKAYDEYMTNGEVHQTGVMFFPSETERYCTIFGAYSDIERITAGSTKGVTRLSRKPTTIPQLVVNGDTFAYTPPYSEEQRLEQSSALTPPQSKVVTISKEGAQILGYQSVYALPASEAKNRQTFRFINSFGVLESINVPKASLKKITITSNQYTVARQETFNSFSHGIVRKQNNRESWSFATDPLDEAWLHWYLHEFLMAENIWMNVNGTWLRCHITPEEETTFLDRTKNEVFMVSFTVKLDINGSPLL